MSGIELVQPLGRQPDGPAELLDQRQVFGYSRNRIFLARPAGTSVIEPALIAAVSDSAGADGIAGSYNGTSSGWYCSPVFSGIPGEATLLAIVRPAVADSSERTILSLSNIADDNPLFRLETEGSNKYRFQIRGNVDSANITSTTSVVAGTTAVVGGVYRDSTREKSVWVNGRKEGTATNNLGSASFSRTTLGVLSRSGNGQFFSGLIFEAHVLPYAASDGWMAEATRNPLALLNAIYAPRRIWVPVSAGGAAYTLTVTQGTYDLTGQSIGVNAQRRLSVSQGSYALTGNSVGLSAQRRLAITQGVYALTGNDVTLTAALAGAQLSITQGSYTLNGQSINLAAARRLSVTQGSYSLTGNSVALNRGRVPLAVTSGTYALTGQDIQLRAALRLAITTGFYALTGFPVALTASTEAPPPPPTAPGSGAGGGGGASKRSAAQAQRELLVARQRQFVIATMMMVISGALDD